MASNDHPDQPRTGEAGQQQPVTASYPSAPRSTTPYPVPGQPTDSRASEGYRGGYSTAWSGQGDYGSDPYRPPAPGFGTGAIGNQPTHAAPGGFPPAPGAPASHGGYPPPAGGYGQPDWTSQQPSAPARAGRRPLLTVALVAALLGGGVGGGIVAIADHTSGRSVNSGIRVTNSQAVQPAQLNGTIGAAAAKIRPSVVTINVASAQEAATGSGVIIKSNGTILTNDHVIDLQGGSIQVMLSDGRTAPAKILGRDTSDDLAVIKVDGLDNLTAATFAKSSTLSVGQTVVAIGAPLGLSDTVTSGIISNLARPVRAGDNDQAVFNAVQTDAAINPGNSGGPLVDLSGSVVGINAAIASDQSGGGLQIPGQQSQAGNIGIGFAIPADEASRIAGELIVNGKATHAVLGVTVTNSSSNTQTAGVPLHSVTAGGVGDKAGLKVGDLVTQIDDQRVTTADALIAAVRSHAPGDKVKVSFVRNGKPSSVSVTLGSSDS
ncbi:MAG TPA: trypsin-like peptidase domain-containing protein [Jatrophihabitans sp.]|nr:trypsin-like peptidase domain-containing protein [Jatrophihabitans sp.]